MLPWICPTCPTCRAVRAESFRRCTRCQSHVERAQGVLSDVVAPISYSPGTSQHHYNLRTYKAGLRNTQARWNLLAILLLFLRDPLGCLAKVTGASPIHLAVVPSTRDRPGAHPLSDLVGSRLGLPRIPCGVRVPHGPEHREFEADWFKAQVPAHDGPIHALVLEDTWTSGARAQSMAHALKSDGVASVATVAIGRYVDPDFRPSKRLLQEIGEQPLFDTGRCAVDDLGGQ